MIVFARSQCGIDFVEKKTKRCLLIIFHCTRNTELRDLRDLLQNCATRRLLAVALLGLDGLICVIYRYINRMIAVLYMEPLQYLLNTTWKAEKKTKHSSVLPISPVSPLTTSHPCTQYTWACRDCCSSSRAGPCPWATGRFRLSKGQVTNKKLRVATSRRWKNRSFAPTLDKISQEYLPTQRMSPICWIEIAIKMYQCKKNNNSTFHCLNLSPTKLPLIGTPPGDYATA